MIMLKIRHPVSVCLLLLLTGCSTMGLESLTSRGSATSQSSGAVAKIQPSHVKIYYGNNGVPKNYKVIGRVGTDNNNLIGMAYSQQEIANELQKQAASIGGRGVINVSTGFEQTTGDVIR